MVWNSNFFPKLIAIAMTDVSLSQYTDGMPSDFANVTASALYPKTEESGLEYEENLLLLTAAFQILESQPRVVEMASFALEKGYQINFEDDIDYEACVSPNVRLLDINGGLDLVPLVAALPHEFRHIEHFETVLSSSLMSRMRLDQFLAWGKLLEADARAVECAYLWTLRGTCADEIWQHLLTAPDSAACAQAFENEMLSHGKLWMAKRATFHTWFQSPDIPRYEIQGLNRWLSTPQGATTRTGTIPADALLKLGECKTLDGSRVHYFTGLTDPRAVTPADIPPGALEVHNPKVAEFVSNMAEADRSIDQGHNRSIAARLRRLGDRFFTL